jgi:hypothetical protein
MAYGNQTPQENETKPGYTLLEAVHFLLPA